MSKINELYQMLDKADKLAATGDAQAQQDAKEIAAQIKLEEAKEQKAGEFPPLFGGTLGAGAGVVGQLGVKGTGFARNIGRAAENINVLADQIKANMAKPPTSPVTTSPVAPGGSAWNKELTGLSVPGSQMSKPWLDVNRSIQNVVSPLSDLPEFRGGAVSPAGVITPPQIGGQPTAPAQPSGAFATAVDRAKQVGGALPRVGGSILRAAGPIAGGFGAGFEGAEAMNRFDRGDPLGGTISTIGAIGGAASMYPPLAPIGLPLSYGAMGLNYLIDKYRGGPKYKSVMEKADGGLVGGLSSLPQPAALTAQMAQQNPPQLGLPPVHSLDIMSSPSSSGSRPFPDAYNPNMRYAPPFKEGGSTTPAWQRKEGKSPSGGLNAVGRASYHRETGGTLKAPQPEGGSRKKSFCARMGGMKKKLTSSKTANDPDSRINKALRKWKC